MKELREEGGKAVKEGKSAMRRKERGDEKHLSLLDEEKACQKKHDSEKENELEETETGNGDREWGGLKCGVKMGGGAKEDEGSAAGTGATGLGKRRGGLQNVWGKENVMHDREKDKDSVCVKERERESVRGKERGMGRTGTEIGRAHDKR
uniref:Uncharacterized protein n=1 Tax=Pseudictyota dubia TaxID=2749911 RepID=A0A7R9VB22_9STRA|mmetsp:Transcript_10054/g.19197  ORF Transcript_10054/g.19197 Transcript_10054/m.19197 type:complete len:150 (+) Transcript_10054:549-998(+)